MFYRLIKEITNSLRKNVPDAFLKAGEEIPEVSRRGELKEPMEPIPFNRFNTGDEIPVGTDPWELIPTASDISENLTDDKELRKEVEEYGIDVLAWYQPFHFFQNWGIFIRWRGIKYLAFFAGKKEKTKE